MKTTGECLNAETIELGSKSHTAFVFIKPHANKREGPRVGEGEADGLGPEHQVRGHHQVFGDRSWADEVGSQMDCLIDEAFGEPRVACRKDKKKLIDTHYGAIAAKAVKLKPKDLVVQEKAQEEFEKMFGVAWSKVMEDGLVFNAMDGAKKLGISPDELGKKYDALKKGETIIKFGGGFYCGKVDGIYAAWW